MKSIKILFSLSLLMIMTSLNVTAQLGVKAGVNFSSLKYFSDDDQNFNEEYVTGYQIGLVYMVPLGDKINLQPEAAFYTRGGKADFNSVQYEQSMQFANLSALLNLNLLGGNEGLSVFLSGGLFSDFALGGKVKTTVLGSETEASIDFSDDDDYNRINAGYIIGGGVKLNSFIIALRGSFGVTELFSFDSSIFSSNANYKTREYSLVGILVF